MRYKAAAFDYDGTLAHVGVVDPLTIEALKRLKGSGRKLVLVTGRVTDDIKRVFPEYWLFDRIVTENGAVMYTPGDSDEQLLTQPADKLLVEELSEYGVQPLHVGRCIIATYRERSALIADVIKELTLDYALIFNKEHLMLLPMGVDKAFGLRAALGELHLSPSQTVAFGDAENDEVMFAACGFGVAVQNAVPALKVISNYIAAADHGYGVAEALQHLLHDEFAMK